MNSYSRFLKEYVEKAISRGCREEKQFVIQPKPYSFTVSEVPLIRNFRSSELSYYLTILMFTLRTHARATLTLKQEMQFERHLQAMPVSSSIYKQQSNK